MSCYSSAFPYPIVSNRQISHLSLPFILRSKGEPVLDGLPPLDMETMRRTDLEYVVELGGEHRWEHEDGDEENPMWNAEVFDADTVKDQTVGCERCELTACGYWWSPGKSDCCLCFDCSEADEVCNTITSKDAVDDAHWKIIEKYCSQRKSKRRRK